MLLVCDAVSTLDKLQWLVLPVGWSLLQLDASGRRDSRNPSNARLIQLFSNRFTTVALSTDWVCHLVASNNIACFNLSRWRLTLIDWVEFNRKVCVPRKMSLWDEPTLTKTPLVLIVDLTINDREYDYYPRLICEAYATRTSKDS